MGITFIEFLKTIYVPFIEFYFIYIFCNYKPSNFGIMNTT